jgi:hypothetical protein
MYYDIICIYIYDNDAMMQWCNDAMMQWCNDAMVQCDDMWFDVMWCDLTLTCVCVCVCFVWSDVMLGFVT